MQPADIARLVTVKDPRVSPDGRHVAFVVTRADQAANRYRSAVWVAAVDGSRPPYPVTAGEYDDGQPRWSPDGQRLAFTSGRRAEEGRATLHVLPFGLPGETLTVCERDEAIEQPEWSPDGTRIAFLSRERAGRHADGDDDRARPPRRVDRLISRVDGEGFIVDRPRGLFMVAADGTTPPVPLAGGPYEHGELAWAPDGRTVAVTAARDKDWDLDAVMDVHLVDVDAATAAATAGPDRTDGAIRALTRRTLSHSHPAFSPDGSRLAVLAQETRVEPSLAQVAVIEVETGEQRTLTASLDRACAPYPNARPPVWTEEGLLFAVEDRGDVHLYRVRADGSGAAERLVGGTRAITGYDAAGGTLAYVAGTPTALLELFVLEDGAERQLTSVGAAFHASVTTCPPEHFTVASPAGDGDLDVWLVRPDRPADGQRVPVLLSIHGGPSTQYANAWFDEFQLWAGAGYAVVYTNPHGSTGYTEAWARAIRSPESADAPGTGWGGIDADDVLAALDAALEREPALDPERVGVLGGSYGGYLTSWLIGHTDRFAAACSERAVNNLESAEWSSDFAGLFHWGLGVRSLDAPEEYRRMSPISYVRDIHTPVLILHSEDDLRCQIEQADQLFVALRTLDRPVEYWRFPQEGHELSRSGSPRHRMQRAEIILDWFGRHLGGRRPAITWDHPSRTTGG